MTSNKYKAEKENATFLWEHLSIILYWELAMSKTNKTLKQINCHKVVCSKYRCRDLFLFHSKFKYSIFTKWILSGTIINKSIFVWYLKVTPFTT